MNRNMTRDLNASACSPVKRLADGSLEQSFCLGDDFIGFAGHFPGYPVVPAVAQMLATQVLLEEALDTPLELAEISHAKFLKQLQPGQDFRVACREKNRSSLCYDARIHVDGELAASFRLTFVPREPLHD